MDEEKWQVIKIFDTHEVSTMGRVKNIKTGIILKGSLNAGGYRCVSLSRSGDKSKCVLVHMLVCDTFLPQITAGENVVVNHISIKEASDELKLDAPRVSACCIGKRKSHRGYTFKYSEELPVSEEIPGEIWKQYKETKYYISDQGRIKTSYNKIMRQQKDLAGYCRVQLRIDKKQTTFLVHRLVAEVYCSNLENLETVDHINGDTSDNRAINLRYVSRKDNIRLANCIPVDQIELSSGKVLKTWPSTTDV